MRQTRIPQGENHVECLLLQLAQVSPPTRSRLAKSPRYSLQHQLGTPPAKDVSARTGCPNLINRAIDGRGDFIVEMAGDTLADRSAVDLAS
ncbi:MAG: hypothetical protein EBY17_25525 [Acidobacteriia bacterium]|nr:hypothetical protein [Terriglobia bacterium]